MIRNVVGFAGFAVVALLALKLLGGLFGFAISIFMTLLWLAFWGFILYLVLRVISPSTGSPVKHFSIAALFLSGSERIIFLTNLCLQRFSSRLSYFRSAYPTGSPSPPAERGTGGEVNRSTHLKTALEPISGEDYLNRSAVSYWR